MLNAITVDVEDYFHVEAFASEVSYEYWDRYTPRVERNVDRVLALFDRYKVRGTFFVLGWVAQRFPRLVRRITALNHEIGCHGFAHRRLHTQTPDQFRADLRDARNRIVDEVQKPIRCYRAPSFSIVRNTLWAFDVLAEEGFDLDSSVFPVRHDLYGIPDSSRFPHWHTTGNGNTVFEFPPSTVRRYRNNWGVGGGGYLRFAPYRLTRWALRVINEQERQPAMVYFHPWEIDPEQPRIPSRWRSRLRHYTNLETMEGKIARLLRDFRFTTFSEACQELEVFQARQTVMPALQVLAAS
jgi:polysaccharide deacetylase family protein (PEP-CTERM system associated)